MASYVTDWAPAYEWALQEWITAKESGVWSGEPYGFSNHMATGGCDVVLGSGIKETLSEEILSQYNETYEAIMNGDLVPELNIEEPVTE